MFTFLAWQEDKVSQYTAEERLSLTWDCRLGVAWIGITCIALPSLSPGRRQRQSTPVLLPGKSHGRRSLVGCSPRGRWELDTTQWLPTFTFHFHALEKEMATHSSVLAWRIPGTGEPGGLPSMGSHRVRHDWSDLAIAVAVSLLVSDYKCFLWCNLKKTWLPI